MIKQVRPILSLYEVGVHNEKCKEYSIGNSFCKRVIVFVKMNKI